MEQQLKTYGVFGMMEYQAVIKVGSKTVLKINFTDGSLTAMGTTPARYSTTNFMVQHAIENSYDFKRGLIKLIGTPVKLGTSVKIERNEPKPIEHIEPIPAPAAERTDFAQQVEDSDPTDAVKKEVNHVAETLTAVSEEALEVTAVPAEAFNVDKTEKGVKQVTVHCNDDAKDYLADNCGCVRSKLRNRPDIMEAAAANGIEFIFD